MSATPSFLENIVEVLNHTPQGGSEQDIDDSIDSTNFGQQRQELENKRYRKNTKQRTRLADWTKFVVTGWLACTILVICLNKYVFQLSDSVLIALLGTTTLNVLGLAYIVLKGYFHVLDEKVP